MNLYANVRNNNLCSQSIPWKPFSELVVADTVWERLKLLRSHPSIKCEKTAISHRETSSESISPNKKRPRPVRSVLLSLLGLFWYNRWQTVSEFTNVSEAGSRMCLAYIKKSSSSWRENKVTFSREGYTGLAMSEPIIPGESMTYLGAILVNQ